MAKTTPTKVQLGEQSFELRRPTLGELRAIVDALDGMAGSTGGRVIDAAVGVLVAGLRPNHPDLTAEQVLALTATMTELDDAVATVLRAAGLRQTEDTPGEAGPQLAAA